MCGLAGFLHTGSFDRDRGLRTLERMGEAILHRGPDQGGEWIDADAGIGLASRRLAIIDLSEAGHQPMHSASERFVLSYNGEVYNHLELRTELESIGKAPNWRGTSDTETLLAGIEAWGLGPTLQRTRGMFALALWDRSERTLSIARDRLGEKPMYFGWQGSGPGAAFLFGSELKALACHPAFEDEIDRAALSAYMSEGYVPAPFSIYRGISKLAPGTILTVRGSDRRQRVESYWSAADAIRAGTGKRDGIGEAEALDELERLLGDAVRGQLISDVPLGAFLSGGIDSSVIVALMQRASSAPVQTFTIGFEDQRFDEAPFAREVAAHLGTDHHELTITAADTLGVVPRLPSIYDEPFADSSQVPTFLISQLARRSVTVALSGDGGDELFGGYGAYLHASRLWRRVGGVPAPLRAAAAAAIGAVPAGLWNGLGSFAKVPARHSTFADRVRKGRRLIRARSVAEMRRSMSERWPAHSLVVAGGSAAELSFAVPDDAIESLMAMDLQQYLPDDILVKVDRAAMAVSLETRAPYLDHRVVEFAWRLPLGLKIRDGIGKWILRRLLARHIPMKLIDRPKRGFSIPTDEWLRGPLKSWAADLLSPVRLREQGFIRPEPVQAAWQAHMSGVSNRQAQLWTVLMFQAWLESRSANEASSPGIAARR